MAHGRPRGSLRRDPAARRGPTRSNAPPAGAPAPRRATGASTGRTAIAAAARPAAPPPPPPGRTASAAAAARPHRQRPRCPPGRTGSAAAVRPAAPPAPPPPLARPHRQRRRRAARPHRQRPRCPPGRTGSAAAVRPAAPPAPPPPAEDRRVGAIPAVCGCSPVLTSHAAGAGRPCRPGGGRATGSGAARGPARALSAVRPLEPHDGLGNAPSSDPEIGTVATPPAPRRPAPRPRRGSCRLV
jgi:hypothetical protein